MLTHSVHFSFCDVPNCHQNVIQEHVTRPTEGIHKQELNIMMCGDIGLTFAYLLQCNPGLMNSVKLGSGSN